MERITITPTNNPEKFEIIYDAGYDETNLLRRSLISEIPCYAIRDVTFLTKEGYYAPPSSTMEEISSRLGQAPLVQSYLTEESANRVYVLDAVSTQGIRIVTTRDIAGLELVDDFEIVRLKAGEHITCEIRLDKATPRKHMKYMVTSLVGVKEARDGRGHILIFELTGQYPIEEVMRLAIEGLPNVLTDVPENMYYKLAPTANP